MWFQYGCNMVDLVVEIVFCIPTKHSCLCSETSFPRASSPEVMWAEPRDWTKYDTGYNPLLWSSKFSLLGSRWYCLVVVGWSC